MAKTILITGATDGIGLATAKRLASEGHTLLIHGRNPKKLDTAIKEMAGSASVKCYQADLSDLNETSQFIDNILHDNHHINTVINNAGVFKMASPITKDQLDSRFVVNTISPYLITQGLLPSLSPKARVVNLSSAAQAPVDVRALSGEIHINDEFNVYAQSKLALTMWSKAMGEELKEQGPMIVSVNPGSLLASKMVKEGFGVAGSDINIGADILCRAALSDEFAHAGGAYYDNDSKCFSNPHPDALDPQKVETVIEAIEGVIARFY